MTDKVYNLFARYDRTNGDFLVFAQDYQFGRLVLGNERSAPGMVFVSDDQELEQQVNSLLKPSMQLMDRLAIVRAAYVALDKQYAAESAAEHASELAALRALEHNQEHVDEMNWQDCYYLG